MHRVTAMNMSFLFNFKKLSTYPARPVVTTLRWDMMFAFAFVGMAMAVAQAQTFTVIHNFTGGADGSVPLTGLTMNAAGDFYGTTVQGGNAGDGTIFKLTHHGSGWVLNPLYSFTGGNDGSGPSGKVAMAGDGSLYGVAYYGGDDYCPHGGCGTVFHLTPSPAVSRSALAPWSITVLYAFTGSYDGANPQGELAFDQSGNLYGSTTSGGNYGNGVIYELTPSGGGWLQRVLYAPQNNGDGAVPYGGVVFDRSGDLYGVFGGGGPYGAGAVYQLSRPAFLWTEQTLYGFSNNGADYPIGGLIIDPEGNLYGTTRSIGGGGSGTVFELTPSNGGWTFDMLYALSGGDGPWDKLVMDGAGNLYGTTYADGGIGSVFKLTPGDGGWTFTTLHDFTGGSDGSYPVSDVVLDANGNLYGTASGGGAFHEGVVWEITP